MTAREALHRAICADPAADLPRLVFADWLDENDEPERAEHIRLSVRLAGLTPEDDDFAATRIRALAVLRRHGPGWFGAAHLDPMPLDRGIPTWPTLHGIRRFPGVVELFDTRPTSTFTFDDGLPDPAAWDGPHLARLSEAIFAPQPETDPADALRVLRELRHMTRLRTLRVQNVRWDAANIAALAAVPHLSAVPEWHLDFADDDALKAFAAKPPPGMAALNAEGTVTNDGPAYFLTDDGFAALVASAAAERLTELRLAWNELYRVTELRSDAARLWRLDRLVVDSDQAGAVAVWAVRAPSLIGLRQLELRGGRVETDFTAARFRPTTVDLSLATSSRKATERAFAAEWLSRVRYLAWPAAGWSPAAARTLAWSPAARSVRTLSGVPALDGVLRELHRGGPWQQLRELRLSGRPTAEMIARLVGDRLAFPELVSLRLSGGKVLDPENLAAVAAEPGLTRMLELDLAASDLPPASAAALVDSPHAANLQVLTAGGNVPPKSLHRLEPRFGSVG